LLLKVPLIRRGFKTPVWKGLLKELGYFWEFPGFSGNKGLKGSPVTISWEVPWKLEMVNKSFDLERGGILVGYNKGFLETPVHLDFEL